MAKKTTTAKKPAKATKARRAAPSRKKAAEGDQPSPETAPAPTGEPGPPTAEPKKGKVTGYTFPIDGKPDGTAVAITRPDPEEPPRGNLKPGLYWNEQGQIYCEKHAPYPGSDTWVFEHWKKVDRASIKEAEEKGTTLVCETCKAIADGKEAAPPEKGRPRKTTKPEPKRFSNRPKPSEPDMSVTRLAAAYLGHLRDAGKSMATQFSYSMDLGIAKRELGPETRIADLTPERVAAFFESEAVTRRRNGKRKSQVTIDKTRRVLRMALEWAEEDCRIAKAPLPAPTESE